MTAPNAKSYGISLVTARFLSVITSVRPDERRHAVGAFLTLFGFMTGRPEFLDIGLLYALLNVIGTLAVLKFFRYGSLGHGGEEEAET